MDPMEQSSKPNVISCMPCAAKVLHPTIVDPFDPGSGSILQRFQQECELLSSIRHPHIVQYLGMCIDPDSNLPVLLMELLDENLTKMLEKSNDPLPYCVQLDLCNDIALAVSYLHSNGIVHRDLSGNNVLVIAGRRAKVTDFGMSKLVSSNRHLTPLTLCPGTIAYMSPEAFMEPPRYTEKLDVFSEGVIMIQVITRLFPNPGSRVKQVQDERSPTGTLQIPILEMERRSGHVQLIDHTHPLLSVAAQCLEYQEKDRPTSQELCERLAVLKESPEYTESRHEGLGVSISASAKIDDTITLLQREREKLAKQIEAKDRDILSKDQEIGRKDAELFTQNQILALKNEELAAKDDQVENLEIHLEHLSQQLLEKELEIAAKNREILTKDKEVGRKDHSIDLKDEELTEKDRQVENLKIQLEHLYQKLLEKEQTISEFQKMKRQQLNHTLTENEKQSNLGKLLPSQQSEGEVLNKQENEAISKAATNKDPTETVPKEFEDQDLVANPKDQEVQRLQMRLDKTLLEHKLITETFEETNDKLHKQIEALQRQNEDLWKRLHEVRTPDLETLSLSSSGAESAKEGINLKWRDGGEAPFKDFRGSSAVDGCVAYFVSDSEVYAFDTTSRNWSTLPKCPQKSGNIVIVQGLLTMVGGILKSDFKMTNKIFSLTKDGAWVERFPTLPTKRCYATATMYMNHLIVVGGLTMKHNITEENLNTVDVLNTDTLIWFTAASLPQSLKHASATISGENLYLLGGNDTKSKCRSVFTCSLPQLLKSCQPHSSLHKLKKIQVGRISTRSQAVWMHVADVPVYCSTCTTVRGHLLAIGGRDENDKRSSAVFKYDPATDQWNVISRMNTARYSCYAVVVNSYTLIVVGGRLEEWLVSEC